MQLQTFDDLGSFALHLVALEGTVRKNMKAGLEAALVVIETAAKEEIGYYQAGVGEFPAWAPLADSTEAEKARLGAPSNAPLLRHGGMYASFGHETEDLQGVVGSTDPTLIYHEFGTSKMPPRPVLGPALVKNRDHIQKILANTVFQALCGVQLGKDFVALATVTGRAERLEVGGVLDGKVTRGGAAYFGGRITP